jgi:PAS domain S-box-containing protein
MQFPNSALDPASLEPASYSRRALMRSFDLPGLADDPRLTAITDFAAALCEAPVALVSFVEEQRQWFAARTGLEARETPRDTSFCAHAMLGTEIMVVPDASLDARFADNPLVTGEPHIRFYAGAPLITDDGTPMGALCVIDTRARAGLSALQRQGLQVLAADVMSLLTLRRAHALTHRERDETDARFHVLADTMPQMVWSTRPDGFCDYFNARWYEFTGVPQGSSDGAAWDKVLHPDDQPRAWAAWDHSVATGEPYEVEYRMRSAAGRYRWILARALPIRADDGEIVRWFGTCTDIHDNRMLQEQREVVAHELSHRIKNIFSIISGLITFTTRFHPEMKVGAEALRERVLALGRAHNFIGPQGGATPAATGLKSLHGLLEELLVPYRGQSDGRVAITGEDIRVDDRSATPFALLFHELATNAAKYGALCHEHGTVTVHTRLTDALACIEWRENGGPPVIEPMADGFGSKLIELSIVRQMGGSIERDWQPTGLVMRVAIPLTSLNR